MKQIMISGFIMMSSLNAEQFIMTGKLIKAKISYQNLNRISVKGDKIDTLVGIDTAFHCEKNEKTGDAFIRPTEDNGYSPISISVTTTSGNTQDLLLDVVDGDAHSIELISENVTQEEKQSSDYLSEADESSTGSDYEENLADIMRKFINLSSNYKEENLKVDDRPHSYVTAKFQAAYRIDGFLCLKFLIKTERQDATFFLDERMFSRKGDIALSLSTLCLGKSRSAILYVLRR